MTSIALKAFLKAVFNKVKVGLIDTAPAVFNYSKVCHIYGIYSGINRDINKDVNKKVRV